MNTVARRVLLLLAALLLLLRTRFLKHLKLAMGQLIAPVYVMKRLITPVYVMKFFFVPPKQERHFGPTCKNREIGKYGHLSVLLSNNAILGFYPMTNDCDKVQPGALYDDRDTLKSLIEKGVRVYYKSCKIFWYGPLGSGPVSEEYDMWGLEWKKNCMLYVRDNGVHYVNTRYTSEFEVTVLSGQVSMSICKKPSDLEILVD